MTDTPDQEQQPLLRIVKGDPTPDEVAALVAVVSALAAGAQAASAKAAPKPEWGAHHRRVRGRHRHGPGAWRASAR
ncbi:MAG: acyl-CoA carboxylase epsilon subunit [Marmoricola sp.]